MEQPSVPPLPSLSPQPLPPQPAVQGGGGGGCQVRCAGCKMILTVGPGLLEFVCPTCQLPQMLPPELMRAQQQRTVPAHGIDPTKIQLPCAHCKAILNVPHGLSRFNCPQCGVDLAVDLSKMKQFFPSPPPRLPPPLEEVNEECPGKGMKPIAGFYLY
ncbi:unnamed protein product [Ilex paraguariensis]|uniref:Uncharacterized protein n=1 Tax=Ilex paraguariensis TaxID=185542 RepID=A0ABC8UFA6_9AQUA